MHRPVLILICCLFHVQCSTLFTGEERHALAKREIRGNGGTGVLASVREYPSELHKCTASFIKPDVLLTVAACIYSEDPQRLFVRASSKHLTDSLDDHGKSLFISKIVTHPNFVRTSRGNDVGLIILKTPADRVTVFSLPQTNLLAEKNLPANIFKWEFSDSKTDFFMHYMHVYTVASSKCSIVLRDYIDGQHICVEGSKDIIMGSYDKGSPLTTRNRHNPYILGLYDRQGRSTELLIEVYQSILPFVDWIQLAIKTYGGNGTDVITTTSAPSAPTQTTTTIKPNGMISDVPDNPINNSGEPTAPTPNGADGSDTTPSGSVTTQNAASGAPSASSVGPDTTPDSSGSSGTTAGASDATAVTGGPDANSGTPSRGLTGPDAGTTTEASGTPAQGPDTTPGDKISTPQAPDQTTQNPNQTPVMSTVIVKTENSADDVFDYDTIKVPLFDSENLGSSRL